MRRVLAIVCGYLAAVLAVVGLSLAVSEVIGNGGLLRVFDATSPVRGLVAFVGITAMVGMPGWVLGRGLIEVLRLRALWAYALAGAGTAAAALALVPGMPFSFGMIGMGAVAGVVAALVERRFG